MLARTPECSMNHAKFPIIFYNPPHLRGVFLVLVRYMYGEDERIHERCLD